MTQFPGLTKQDWPRDDQASLDAFYGVATPEGTDLVTVAIPWRCSAQSVRVARKCAASLERVLGTYWNYVGRDQSRIDAEHLNICDGAFNYRSVRGSTTLSNHARGAAIDWAAAYNPLASTWHPGGSMLPVEFVQAFQAEGWRWGGLYKGRKDPMHFEGVASDQPPVSADSDLPLSVGSVGPKVKQVQIAVGADPDGIYGEATQDAVKTWQASHNLDADGVVGSATWEALVNAGSAGSPAPPPVAPKPPAPPPVPRPPIVVSPSSPLEVVLDDILQVVVQKSGIQQNFDRAKAGLLTRATTLANELADLVHDINDLKILVGPPPPVVVSPPAPPPTLPLPPPAPPTRPQPPGPSSPTTLPPDVLSRVVDLAGASPVADHPWSGRGAAPAGYVKGVAATFALVYQKYLADDPAATQMARANSGDDDKDALSWYDSNFRAIGMSNAAPGADALRHLFVLLLGLGMRESSGNCFEGYDVTAASHTSTSAEAGLFQQSYDSFSASPELPRLMAAYQANPTWGFQSIFREGVAGGMTDSVGSGAGADFQRLCKLSPSFAVEAAAVGLRVLRRHWGPINRKEAELLPAADQMFLQIQDIVEKGNKMPSTPSSVVVPVESAAASKINWTQWIQIAAQIALFVSGGKLNIDPATQATLAGVLGVLGPALTSIFRTYFTTSITPSSAAKV